ncbi:hypothetical protein HDU97_003338 [Phlyctochytrium planicorne]|nr:hypothetical protein HDU97_003338 [Phlyctochytrium planicorne]
MNLLQALLLSLKAASHAKDPTTALASGIAIPIQRTTTLNISESFFQHTLQVSAMRFAGFSEKNLVEETDRKLDRLSKRAATAGLNNNMNLLYAASVTLGNGQTFNVHVDTGSADTWIRGPSCVSPDRSCVGPKVDVSSLSSANRPFSTSYGSGAVAGGIYTTTFTVGGQKSQPLLFGVTTQEVGFDDDGYTDGLMGLAFDSISNIRRNTGGNTNFFDQLGFPGGQRRFGVYLSNAGQGSGELVLGGDNPGRYSGTVTCLPLAQQSYWVFSIASATYKVRNAQGSLGGSLNYAIADTGTTLAILDDRVASNINSAIGASFNSQYGVYIVPCSVRDNGPAVVFNMGGADFSIPSSIYVLQDGSGTCFSGFAGGASGGSVAILGDTFLRAYYSIYDKDNSRVCFARANH